MDDEDRRLGRVPDKDLAAHGSVPRPTLREKTLTERSAGTELDRELRGIPKLPREF